MLDILKIIGPPGSPLFIDWGAPNIQVVSMMRLADWIFERLNKEKLVNDADVWESVSVVSCWELLDSTIFIILERQTFEIDSSTIEDATCLKSVFQGLHLEVVNQQLIVKHLFSVSSVDAMDTFPSHLKISDYYFDCRFHATVVDVSLVLKLTFRWRRGKSLRAVNRADLVKEVGTHRILFRQVGDGNNLRFIPESYVM